MKLATCNANLYSCGDRGGSEELTQAYSDVRRGERRSANEGIHMKANWHNLERAAVAASPYDPEKIEIAAQEGTPFVVRLKKRPVLVKDVVNMWRIDEEWWRKPISRLYFSLELENGARITVFRDLVAGAWYRQNWA